MTFIYGVIRRRGQEVPFQNAIIFGTLISVNRLERSVDMGMGKTILYFNIQHST